jgi:hypothetical protein
MNRQGVVISARVPKRVYGELLNTSKQRGLVRMSGEPNISATVRTLIHEALQAESKKYQEANGNET